MLVLLPHAAMNNTIKRPMGIKKKRLRSIPDSPYVQSIVELQAGDLLTAFTDGITESENKHGEQFGEQRLTDLLIRYRERPLNEIVLIVTDAVRDWASDLDNQDDTTILLARRL